MSTEQIILELQWRQLNHDDKYHRDILLLDVADRMKHMTLHMAKYIGAMAEASASNDDAKIARTLVDAMIICTASANTLNLSIGSKLSSELDPTHETLRSVGIELANSLERQSRDTAWTIMQVAIHTGRLAKACESIDHLESFRFREQLTESVLQLFKLIAAEIAVRQIDFERRISDRLREVERRNIFDKYYQNYVS